MKGFLMNRSLLALSFAFLSTYELSLKAMEQRQGMLERKVMHLETMVETLCKERREKEEKSAQENYRKAAFLAEMAGNTFKPKAAISRVQDFRMEQTKKNYPTSSTISLAQEEQKNGQQFCINIPLLKAYHVSIENIKEDFGKYATITDDYIFFDFRSNKNPYDISSIIRALLQLYKENLQYNEPVWGEDVPQGNGISSK